MKKIKLLILMMVVFIFGLSNVDAMTLKPTGASSGKRGSEITIYVTLNRTNEEKSVSAVDGKLSFDSNVFSLVSTASLMDSSWIQLSPITNGGTFSYANLTFNSLISDTSKNIAKVVLKINDTAAYGNSTISVSGTNATDDKADSVSISGGNHTVKVLSDVNTLTGITVTGGGLEFNENTTTYDLEVDSDSTTITAIKKDSTSVVTGDIGKTALKYGKNTFKITVTSEAGSKNVYTLNITRPDRRSKVNTLSSLTVSEGKISFKKETLKYSLTVENKIKSIKVDANLTDEKSSFVSGYAPRTVDLKVGTNVIEIKVKAENEEVKTYKITVTRKDDGTKSNNNYLSELSLSQGTLTFDKETLEYTVTVLNDVTKVDVTAKTEHDKATYEIDAPKELVVGNNVITIKVKAENGTIKEYKVTVIKKGQNEELSNNNLLTNLTVLGYELDFNSNVYEYNLKINDENSLTIDYEQEDTKSNVIINGNNELKNGSIIRIVVTAEDGSVLEYKINIEKEESNNFMLFIIIGVVLLLILIVIVVIISNKKKSNNNTSNNTNNMNDLAVNQNNQYMQGQNIQNMVYTQNPTNTQNNMNIQNVQNSQTMQNTSNQSVMQNDNNMPINNNVGNNSNIGNNNQNNNYF